MVKYKVITLEIYRPLHPNARWSRKRLLSLASGKNSFLQSSEVPENQMICWGLCQSKFPPISQDTGSALHLTFSWGRGHPSWQPGNHTPGSASFCHPLSLSVITSKFTTCSLMMVPAECDHISLPLLDKCSCPPYPTVLNKCSLKISEPRVFVPPPLLWKASSFLYSKVR